LSHFYSDIGFEEVPLCHVIRPQTMLALSKLAPTKKPIIMKLAVLVSSSESVESQPSLEKVVVDEATTSALTRHGNCLVCIYIYIYVIP
jgi:hypothetical protein